MIALIKAAADAELYELEKCAIQIDLNNNTNEYSGNDTDDNTSNIAEENTSKNSVSHVQEQIVGDENQNEYDENRLCKTVYGPTYVPYKEDSQKILLLQITDISCKDNLKQLYNSQPKGMCDNEYESLEQGTLDTETFNYSNETSTKHVLVQGVYVGSASPLIANIKT